VAIQRPRLPQDHAHRRQPAGQRHSRRSRQRNKVSASSAGYWDSPHRRLASLISFAKAKITGEAHDGGENETVTM
jgi:hypothetical protein